MDSSDTTMMETPNWRAKFLVIGAILGGLVGAGAAYLFVQAAEREGHPPEVGAGEGVKIGLLLLGVMRSIATLGEGN
jgi:hypothetical protein